ncbi:hypothetical protein CK203_020601 [Vitis vinifera]|uniref:Uncharacterized protein n=1 Tax=Vitis vinifera TaxID=29760 RepID=A0A438FMJ8_VITVI|nr:hypothetical protein CK203_020601 [Vitis vinifera]
MEMEVVIPVPAVDFNFDSACSTPFISAPSSPQRFGNFSSAPPAPHAPLLFTGNSTTLTSPAGTLRPPPRPLSLLIGRRSPEFRSGQLERTSLSADELFDGGKIRPLRPPPRLQLSYNNPDENFKSAISSPKSPRSPKNIFSPRHRKDTDPFAAAIERTRKEAGTEPQYHRGRERKTGSSSSSSATSTAATSRKVTRSLSPLRVSDVTFGSEHSVPQNINNSKLSSSSSKSSRIWRLRDFLLFRSASEGRAASKDPLRKYSLLTKKNEDVKNCSFRSTDSSGSVSSSRRRGPVSAHEMHYTVNRAVSEEMRRKTFLPYKQGLLGCLGFNSTVHEISKGLGL